MILDLAISPICYYNNNNYYYYFKAVPSDLGSFLRFTCQCFFFGNAQRPASIRISPGRALALMELDVYI